MRCAFEGPWLGFGYGTEFWLCEFGFGFAEEDGGRVGGTEAVMW